MKDGISFKLFSPSFFTRKSSSLWKTGPPYLYSDPTPSADNLYRTSPSPVWLDLGLEGRLQPAPAPQGPGPSTCSTPSPSLPWLALTPWVSWLLSHGNNLGRDVGRASQQVSSLPPGMIPAPHPRMPGNWHRTSQSSC